LFALLNPFLMSIYLIDLIMDLGMGECVRVLARGALISGFVYSMFAWGGETLFTEFRQARFAFSGADWSGARLRRMSRAR
jgi:hypothetical protein